MTYHNGQSHRKYWATPTTSAAGLVAREYSQKHTVDGAHLAGTVGTVRSWVVTNTYVEGKTGDLGSCEDIVVASRLYATIDGATDKSGRRYRSPEGESVSSGRFAALVLSREIAAMPAALEPRSAVNSLTEALNDAVTAQHPDLGVHERPSASIVVFDPEAALVWWVGDCRFAYRAGQEVAVEVTPGKLIDTIATEARRAMLAALAAGGRAWDPRSGVQDPGRELILPLLRQQGALANTVGEFGYGVLNGVDVPDRHIGTCSLPSDATDLVLASDGYPKLAIEGELSLDRAEAYLREALAQDPGCAGALASTKGLNAGQISFDDRAWLALTRVSGN